MKIERANLAVYLNFALGASVDEDVDTAIYAGRGPFDDPYVSFQTQQIRDALEAVENGDQLEIVD